METRVKPYCAANFPLVTIDSKEWMESTALNVKKWEGFCRIAGMEVYFFARKGLVTLYLAKELENAIFECEFVEEMNTARLTVILYHWYFCDFAAIEINKGLYESIRQAYAYGKKVKDQVLELVSINHKLHEEKTELYAKVVEYESLPKIAT